MDVEGTMQFILEQQAQFAADIQVMKEVSKAQQERFERDINQINMVLLDVATSQERTNKILAVLADQIVHLDSLMERHITGHN